MACEEKSLRLTVARWLALDPAAPVRVTKFRNKRSIHECYVYVETFKAGQPIGMFFYRHQDGTWRIYPPTRKRPAMCIPKTSALL